MSDCNKAMQPALYTSDKTQHLRRFNLRLQSDSVHCNAGRTVLFPDERHGIGDLRAKQPFGPDATDERQSHDKVMTEVN